MTDMVKMYECRICDYKTGRKDTFLRHQNSKKHLTNIKQLPDHMCEYVVPKCENVVPKCENVVPIGENVFPNGENVHQNFENVARNQYSCQKCNKTYNSRRYLKDHEKICTGVDSLTCPRCMKTFANRKTKSKHCKRDNCKPVSIFEAENVKSIINNNTNQSYNTNSLNTTNINNHITKIYINDYGKERKDYLLAYDNFYDIIRVPNNNILVKYLKCKNFNPLFPENHCIKYENRCFKLKENNNWRLINATALKDKLFYDCGSEVLHAFDQNEEKIRKQIKNIDHFEAVKKKSDFLQLEFQGHDKEIKNSMLDVVKDTT